MIDPFTESLLDDEFEEYRNFMFVNYDLIMDNRSFFISDKYFSTFFKCERVKELLDFFELEEDFEKCVQLKKLYSAVRVDHLFQEIVSKIKVSDEDFDVF